MSWIRWAGGRKEAAVLRLGGFAGGFLLTLPNIFPALAPVQAVALVPVLMALRYVERWRQCVLLGLGMGLAYVAPQVFVLRLPPLMSLVLVVYFLLLFIVFVTVSWRLLASRGVWGSLAFGAFLAVLDWAGFTAMPMWGAAQSLSRCWSWYPQTIAFTSATGITGIAFVLAATQALAVTLVAQRRQRVACIVAFVAVIASVTSIDISVALQEPIGHIRVGAVGWVSSADTPLDSPEGFNRWYAEPVGRAAQQGARLVVSPETAFSIYDGAEPLALSRFVELSQRNGVYLAVGYFDHEAEMNQVAFIGPTQGVMGKYAKTHLTPFEHYRRGPGQPEVIRIDGVSVGAMICQDDNYTDMARRYGAQSTSVIAIPTNDWSSVRKAHLQSTIHRAIESRFAIVRAASNGISAIISPKGKVPARKDHFTEGAGLIVAEVPIYAGRTVFSRFGHGFVFICAVFVGCHVVCLRSKRFLIAA